LSAPESGRKATDRRNRDVEVVQAAIQVFYQKGYAASSVQDVADVVGVLKGSLYHYISSKEDLLLRILQESHEQARQIMEEVAALEVSPLDRLRAYVESMYRWYLANIERVSVYFTAIRAQARELDSFVRRLLTEAQGDGSVRADLDVKLAAVFLQGALNSSVVWYRPSGAYSPAEIARQFTEMSISSLQGGGQGAGGRPAGRRTPKPTSAA
jgi:AcrR family transcriptional regulator